MTGVVNVLDSILSVGHGVQRQATHVEVEEPSRRKDFQNGGCLATYEEDQVQPAMKKTFFYMRQLWGCGRYFVTCFVTGFNTFVSSLSFEIVSL